MIPTTRLAIFIEDGAEIGQEPMLTQWLQRIPVRAWTVAPPVFCWVEVADEPEANTADDDDAEPPAGAFIHVSLPESSNLATEGSSFQDAKVFLEWAAELAQTEQLFLSVEYGDEIIGEIGPDGIDDSVRHGLLDPWEAALRG